MQKGENCPPQGSSPPLYLLVFCARRAAADILTNQRLLRSHQLRCPFGIDVLSRKLIGKG